MDACEERCLQNMSLRAGACVREAVIAITSVAREFKPLTKLNIDINRRQQQ
jgi:hypothetical protein